MDQDGPKGFRDILFAGFAISLVLFLAALVLFLIIGGNYYFTIIAFVGVIFAFNYQKIKDRKKD